MVIDASDGSCNCDTGYTQSGGVYTDEAYCNDNQLVANLKSEYPLTSDVVLGTLTSTVSSLVQEHYYDWAGTNCYYFWDVANIKACQVLANLCVLQHYSEDASPCNILEKLDDLRQKGIPDIFFSDTATVRQNTDITLNYAYEDDDGGLNGKVDFYLSSFSLDGTWLGMEPLASQFFYGPYTPPSIVEDEIGNFGFNIEESFKLNLTDLVAEGGEPLFYELRQNFCG